MVAQLVTGVAVVEHLMTDQKISIIIPMFNEAETISATLESLQQYRSSGHELIVVDGGSDDGSEECARPLVDKLLLSEKGRAQQMNKGAAQASNQILLFLHADTLLPANADSYIINALSIPGKAWGRFSLSLSGKQIIFRIIETSINWRTFISGIATGDQGIFVTREIFEQIDGYDEIPLMEDVALSKKLRKKVRLCCLSQKVISSSRRWEEKGILKTVLLMWILRTAYFFGVDPQNLVRIYYNPAKHQ